MNLSRRTTWAFTTILAVTASCTVGLSAEVTVVGSPWPGAVACPCPQVPVVPQAPAAAAIDETFTAPPETENCITSFLASPDLTSWYTRIDYMQWTTRYANDDLDNEHGALWTIGYQRRWGPERARFEIFGGSMKHSGWYAVDTTPNGDYLVVPNDASANHFGGRGEYEYIWDIPVDGKPPISLYAGIGTRIWSRDVEDGTTIFDERSFGYQQAWVTIYPYIGSEMRWIRNEWCEFYASARIGCTAINYVQMSEFGGEIGLGARYPTPGLTGRIELGLRRKHIVASACFEAMSWPKTEAEHDHGDPSSQMYCNPGADMYTTGLQFGLVW